MTATAAACPSDEELAGHLAGALDAARATAVAVHLDECGTCRAVVVGAVRGGIVTLAAVSDATATARDGARAQRRRGETLAKGTMIGRYRIDDLLGAGGMGVVYVAHDTALDRAVALKVLRPDLSGDPAMLAERLVRESRLMAKASHPGVITVHDVGRADDQVYVAMELIGGETLGKWLKRTPRTVEQVIDMFRRAGAGLGAAHRAGLVHRDFKPDNVLVELDGEAVRRVLVTDFGVARAFADGEGAGVRGDGGSVDDPQLTATGVAVGTPAYMAPEQLSGKDVDERADVFGFAVALWEALYGTRPFTGATPAAIRAAMNELPAPPAPRGAAAARGRIPGWVTRALLAALVANPGARTPSIAALLAALDATPRRRRRRRIAGALAGLIVIGGVTITALAWPNDVAAPDPCVTRLAELDAQWGPARAADVRAALTGKATAANLDAAIADLDVAIAGWHAIHARTCQAGVQSPAIAACLDARRREVSAVASELLGATPIAIEYPQLLVKLVGEIGPCATGAPGLSQASVPDDPALERAVADLRRQVFAIEDLRIAGDYQGALAALPPVEARAQTLGWEPALAEVQYLRGSIEVVASDTEHGVEVLRQAATTAQRAHHDSIAASVWIVLAHSTALDLHQTDRALEYLDYAGPAIERIGSPADLHAQLLYTRGLIQADAHHDDAAERDMRDALAIADKDAPQLIGICVQGLAYILEDRRQYADAAAEYRRALDLLIADAGAGHPDEATYRARLAFNLAMSGTYDEAIVQSRQALAIAEATLDDKQIDLAHAHDGLAEILHITGHADEALVEIDKAVALAETVVGARSQMYGEELSARGQYLMALDRPRDALAALRRACSVLEYTIDDDSIADSLCRIDQAAALVDVGQSKAALHILDEIDADLETSDDPADLASAQLIRGDALIALGRSRDAVAVLEAALTRFTEEPDVGFRAQAELGLARAVAATDAAAALAHAQRAVEIWRGAAPMWQPELRKAEAWVKRRTGT